MSLAFESTGAWGPSMKRFFRMVKKHAASVLDISLPHFARYWRRRYAAQFTKVVHHQAGVLAAKLRGDISATGATTPAHPLTLDSYLC